MKELNESNFFSLQVLEPDIAEKKPAQTKSLWTTPEFIFYAIVFLLVIPQMFLCAYGLSVRKYSEFITFLKKK